MTVVLRFVTGLRYEIAERDVLETIASLSAFRQAFWRPGGAVMRFRVRTTDRGELQVWGAPLMHAWVLGTSELVDSLNLETKRVRTGDEIDQFAVIAQHREADEAGRGSVQLGADLSRDGIEVLGCGQRVANGPTARPVVDDDGHVDLLAVGQVEGSTSPADGAATLATSPADVPTIGAPTDTPAVPSAVGVSVDQGDHLQLLTEDLWWLIVQYHVAEPARLARELFKRGWRRKWPL